ncbi:MAG: PD-(D/E)XK nuclease family protein [bacterium]|nr:PD-(D/E)XK nuclease family protein [bacterium]
MRKVSFSQLMTYIRCPEHWLFQYNLGIRRNPKKILKHGFALHEVFAYHFTEKKKDGKGIKPGEAKEFFADVFLSALDDYKQELEAMRPYLTKEYLAKERQVDINDLLDRGMRGIDAYFKRLNSLIIPDLVEEPFEFQASKNVLVKGRLDLTHINGTIHELKTTRKSPNMQDIRSDPQLAIYQLGYHSIKGKYPVALSKDYIVLGKSDAKITRFKVARPFADKNTVLRNINAIVKATESGIFYCMHPAESWFCSKGWCGYYTLHQELKKLGIERFLAKYSRSGPRRS